MPVHSHILSKQHLQVEWADSCISDPNVTYVMNCTVNNHDLQKNIRVAICRPVCEVIWRHSASFWSLHLRPNSSLNRTMEYYDVTLVMAAVNCNTVPAWWHWDCQCDTRHAWPPIGCFTGYGLSCLFHRNFHRFLNATDSALAQSQVTLVLLGDMQGRGAVIESMAAGCRPFTLEP